ncbi:hypothetical protein NDU88_007395 [Pleurodeles waltl]|uniref:Secreted protein n=1 Tax=Pleurodeles waltl TaxID=8319 RepID=A0AAV7RSY5_PLEWA|nr:hypothetical protein NDU88_007395 [Pleurodeles waltl]
MDLWVGMVWAYFCWRDGGGLVIASFPLTFGVADFCGCRVFGGLPVAGQNDRGGLPRPRQCYGGLLAGGKQLLPPRLPNDFVSVLLFEVHLLNYQRARGAKLSLPPLFLA